jgi:hypothetical protein
MSDAATPFRLAALAFLAMTAFSAGLWAQSEGNASTLHAELCDGHRRCELGQRHQTGRDDVVVQQVRLADAWDVQNRKHGECVPYEWWVVRKNGEDARKLLDLCIGDGARDGVTADSVVVQPNRFIQTSAGGSAWRWELRRIMELHPTRLLRTERYTHWTLGPNQSRRRVDWQSVASRTDWYAPICPNGDGEKPSEAPPSDEWFSFEPIPQVSTSGRAKLGSCAALVDSLAKRPATSSRQGGYGHGYIVDGKPAEEPGDASFRALFVSETKLVVDLRDDEHGPEDHLQLISGRRYHHMDRCVPEAGRERRWKVRRVRLDGSVDGLDATAEGGSGIDAGSGDVSSGPEVLQAEVRDTQGAERLRFEITFPKPPEAVTLAYVDADDGEPRRRIATSRLMEGQPASLGRIQPLETERGTCEVRKGRLEFVPAVSE